MSKPIVFTPQKFYTVLQAVGMEFQGLKALDVRNFQVVAIFPTKEDAIEYFKGIMIDIKHARGLGLRTERNLDKYYEGGLDFCIQACEITVPKFDEVIKHKGWKMKQNI